MTPFLITALAVVMVAMIWLTLEYSILVPPRKGLPVLMYHKVSPAEPDGLSVTPGQFDAHLRYLKKHGYHTITFSALLALWRNHDPLPPRSLIITFDDAYTNFRDFAIPLLKKYGFTASVMVPVAWMGKVNAWDKGMEPILDAVALKGLALDCEAEIGLHSFLHRNFNDMGPEEIRGDLEMCRRVLESEGIPYVPVLAYPYGAFPRKHEERKAALFEVFRQLKLSFALRIGNRINRWPLVNPYEIQRIDIRGTDPLFIFGIKVKKGRAKMFA